MVFFGAEGVANLARCNIYSSRFGWQLHQGADLLCLGGKPVLCYYVGFARMSNILESVPLPNTSSYVKDVTFLPFRHEHERFLSSVCYLAGVPSQFKGYDNGMKVQTRASPKYNDAGPSSRGTSSFTFSAFFT